MDRTVRSALSPIFEIGERFAVGRRGNSYFATVRETGQPVVLKSFFRPVDDEKLEILSRLIEVSERNAGIADVLMVGRLPSGRWFQAREQSDGVPLSEWLSQGALLPQDLSTILIQCALALQALHDAGLAHGSVSPENIIVQSGPNGPTAKFVDVGAVRGLNKRRQRADLRSLAAMGWVASHQQSHAGIDRADNPIQQAMFFGLEQVGRRTMAAPASSGRSLASQMQRGVQPPAVTPRSRRFGFGPMTLRSADLVSVI